MKHYIIRDKFTGHFLAKQPLFGDYYLTNDIYKAIKFKDLDKAKKTINKQDIVNESRLEIDNITIV